MKQTLRRISDHIWIFPFDGPKDRPNLGYIKGSDFALAVDAGHSSSNVEDFYEQLEAAGLPLPELTVLTHWHWDHTFGMHAVHGKTLACSKTNRKLRELRSDMDSDPLWGERFLRSDPSIRREYAGGVPLVIVPADEEFSGDRIVDLGGLEVHIILAESPHTEDAVLVHVPEDRVLFIGDAQLGEFPSWKMDFGKLERLAAQIERLEADLIVDGHWNVYRKQEFLMEL